MHVVQTQEPEWDYENYQWGQRADTESKALTDVRLLMCQVQCSADAPSGHRTDNVRRVSPGDDGLHQRHVPSLMTPSVRSLLIERDLSARHGIAAGVQLLAPIMSQAELGFLGVFGSKDTMSPAAYQTDGPTGSGVLPREAGPEPRNAAGSPSKLLGYVLTAATKWTQSLRVLVQNPLSVVVG